MRVSKHWLAFGLMFVLANCVSLTVNVYFPTSEIREAAEEIEDRVRSGRGTEGLPGGTETSSEAPRTYGITLSFGGKEAQAAQAEVDISIETPTAKQIIASRTKRYKEYEPYMDKGVLAEGMTGYLVLKDNAGLDLKALTQIKKLLKEENDDRTTLYREILTANKLEATKENLAKVEQLFTEAIRKKMKPGHWFQVKKDQWEQKKKEEK